MSSDRLDPGILRDSALLVGGKILAGLITLLTISLIARVLGPHEFGLYSLAFAFAGVFCILAEFGMPYVISGDISKNKRLGPEYLRTGLLAKLLLMTPAIFLFFWIGSYVYSTPILGVIILAILVISIRSLVDYFNYFFVAYQRFLDFTKTHVLLSTLTLLSCLAIISVGYAQTGFFIGIQGVVGFILLVYVYRLILKLVGTTGKASYDISSALAFLKRSLPFGLFMFLVAVYTETDAIMLFLLANLDEVGFYKAALSIAILTEVVPVNLSIVMYPRIAQNIESSLTKTKKIIADGIKLSMVLGVLIGLLVYLKAPEIISLLFGNKYPVSSYILGIMGLLIIVRYFSIVLARSMVACGHQKMRVSLNFLAIVVNITLNYILIPLYGGYGAALATLATSTIVAIVGYLYMGFKTAWIPLNYMPRILASGLLLLVIVSFSPNLISGILFGSLAYFAAIKYLSVIKFDDILLLVKSG